MEKKVLSINEVCDYTINVGISKSNSTTKKTLIKSLLAGMFISFGGFASTMAYHSVENFSIAKLIAGIIFPVGLILVLLCGAELFTGNCLLTLSLWEKKINLSSMLKNWFLVYTGNFLGALFIALLLIGSGLVESNQGHLLEKILKVAQHKGELSFIQAFSSGILCNILVCMAVWASYCVKDGISKIFAIFFPIMTFIISGFEHSVANMYYFSIAILSKLLLVSSPELVAQFNHVNFSSMILNLIPVTIGNIIGGSIVVGWLYYKIK